MPDFRTRPPGGKEGQESGDWLERAFKQAFKNIENDPEAQARLGVALNQRYGLDMSLLAPMLPKMGEGLQALEAQGDLEGEGPPPGAKEPKEGPMNLNDMAENPPETQDVEPTPEARKPTPEELIGFLDQVIGYVGEDFPLGELRDWADENQDLVNTAIELEF